RVMACGQDSGRPARRQERSASPFLVRLATEPFDLGSYLLLAQMAFNLVGYPPAPVAGEPDIFLGLIVRFMNLQEVSLRAAPIRMRVQRLDSKSRLHVAKGTGRQ